MDARQLLLAATAEWLNTFVNLVVPVYIVLLCSTVVLVDKHLRKRMQWRVRRNLLSVAVAVAVPLGVAVAQDLQQAVAVIMAVVGATR